MMIVADTERGPMLDAFESAARKVGLALVDLQDKWDEVAGDGAMPATFAEAGYPFREPLEEVTLRALRWLETVEAEVARLKARL